MGRGEGDGGGMGGEGAECEGAELGVDEWRKRTMGWMRLRMRGAWRGLCVVK